MGYPAIYTIVSIYYPILAAVGIPVNLIAIVILSRGKCGLSKCITCYLVGMAAADFMVVVIAIIAEKINNLYFYASFLLITPVCALMLVVKIAFMDCSVWLTVAFTFDRYVAICCQKLRKRYCTERIATIVIGSVAMVSSVRSVPLYFVVEPFEIIVRNIIAANRVRRGLRSNSENQKDSEVENRRKSMILLFALSANFILLWMPYVIHSMKWQTVNYSYTNKYLNTPPYILQQCGFMLQFLSTCTNTCAYGLTQRKFREELKNGVKFVLTLNGRLRK
ncbi:probable G-protein coupled receptor 139 [Hemitrygon akajei]|uniref:probable G-protein coupled receptor 139 n=1 Tax=Hemitrygon akajei TaxID=2704970 RepID=UPI003BFA0086